MKKRIRQAVCYNCNRPLAQTDNFCPSCGQENTPVKLGMAVLLGDFFSNYFSFDSKISRSTFPFLLKPGFLTNRFNEGKRSSFIHPLRLYLIISFLFFFLLALRIDKLVEEEKISFMGSKPGSAANQAVPPSAAASLQLTLDSAQAEMNYREVSGIEIPNPAAVEQSANNLQKILDMMRNPSYTDEEVMEAATLDQKSKLQRLFMHQGRKVVQKDMDVFLPYLVKNFSIMMFLLLPVFAFYIFLLFKRTEPYYISHAIHALHIHSFSFFVMGLTLLCLLFFNKADSYVNIYLIAFLLITLYAFLSVKRVYKQSWTKTFVKFNLLGLFYFTTLLIGIVLEITISFIMF